MKKAQSSSVIMKNTKLGNSQNTSMNKQEDQDNCKTNRSRDHSCDTNEILTKGKKRRMDEPSESNLNNDEDEILSERRRNMKPSLKQRSSSKVSTVKQELAKQLLKLRSSGENLQALTRERKLKDEASAKGSDAQGKAAEAPDISLKKSTTSFNLQMINKNILSKNEDT
jgi:hypothetical protein